jgi:DNA-binding transcriptional MocR family regulator
MPKRKYCIKLNESEIQQLEKIIKTGTSPARTILRANILLLSYSTGDKIPSVVEVAEICHTSSTTVQKVRTAFAKEGLETAINRKKRDTPPVAPIVDGELEAHLIALCCSNPPEGYARWSLRLLADKTVELGYAESISYVTVGKALKKMNLSLT